MRKKLLFLGCNDEQIPYLKQINRSEWKIIGTDLNNNAPGRLLCDEFYEISYDDLNGLINIGINENFNKFDKVFTAASQFAQKGASHFSKFFGINFPSEETIDVCLNKSLFYKSFKESNISIPKTYFIKNQDELKSRMKEIDSEFFFLKSDFSKNPKYVYSFSKRDVPWSKFFWGKDRYLREMYILQPEVRGHSIRINIYGNRFNTFDFLTGNKTNIYHSVLDNLKIVPLLRNFLFKLGLENCLVKFDVILSDQSYVVLDIGLDPPIRMKKFSKINNINFEECYIKQYLYNELIYPNIFD